jgi:hypothetical protein
LDHKSQQHHSVHTNEQGREDKRKSPGQRDENSRQKASEQHIRKLTAAATDFLAPHHETMLTIESRISPEVVAARGYATVYDPEEVAEMDFADFQVRIPALALPVWDVFGRPLRLLPPIFASVRK